MFPFGKALAYLKGGQNVQRVAWGVGPVLRLIPEVRQRSGNGFVVTPPYIAIGQLGSEPNTIVSASVWTQPIADILADDWVLVDPPPYLQSFITF